MSSILRDLLGASSDAWAVTYYLVLAYGSAWMTYESSFPMCLRRLLAYHEYSLDIFLTPNRVLLCACIFLFSCLMFISRVVGDLALRLSSRSWPLPICDFLLQALRVQAEVLVVS